MRYQDLRRARGIESLWLRLRLHASRFATHVGGPPSGDIGALSDHQLRDIGLDGRPSAREAATYWRLRV